MAWRIYEEWIIFVHKWYWQENCAGGKLNEIFWRVFCPGRYKFSVINEELSQLKLAVILCLLFLSMLDWGLVILYDDNNFNVIYYFIVYSCANGSSESS